MNEERGKYVEDEREREREGERREEERGRKELTASPLVSSHRPNTELAAASTEHLELRVVVIPAYNIVPVLGRESSDNVKKSHFELQNTLPTLAIDMVCCSIAS